jgi:hypothetical protein
MPSPEYLAQAKKFQSEYLAQARKFQCIFSTYFPQFTDFETAAFEMDWIKCRVVLNPLDTVRRRRAKRELRRLMDTLRRLSQCEVPYWQMAIQIGKDDEDKVRGYQRDIMDFLLSLDEMNNHDGLTDEVLAGFEEKASREIDRLPDTLNINWKAVHAVEGLRILWWRNTGGEAPARALNPASSFCRFLGDGLEFLEIDADPVSAFKRWVEAYPYK